MSFNAYNRLTEQLLHQFKYSDNILKLLTVLGNIFQDTLDTAEYILDMVDLDDYVGVHLDYWGELIGVKRPRAQEPDILFAYSEGEIGDLDGSDGFEDDTDPATVILGGYLTSETGIEDQDDPSAEMSDADYRYLILQKANSFRTAPTKTALYNYLLAFGSRCIIDDDTTFAITYDPIKYYDLNEWEKWYAVNKGLNPHSINIRFLEKSRNEDPI